MLVVCIHGAPGVGKLSVGRQLENATGFILIHDHLVIETAAVVFPFGEARFSRLRSKLFADLLDGACSSGNGIILTHANDIFWEPSFAAMVKDCTKRYGYVVKRVFLSCDYEQHVKRISDPHRARYRKINDMERLRRLIEAGEFKLPVAERGDLSVDTTKLLPLQVAGKIGSSLDLLKSPQAEVG
jgi:shikimate kinase